MVRPRHEPGKTAIKWLWTQSGAKRSRVPSSSTVKTATPAISASCPEVHLTFLAVTELHQQIIDLLLCDGRRIKMPLSRHKTNDALFVVGEKDDVIEP